MHKIEEIEPRFCIALVCLLRNFNYLESNLGLCISQVENPDNPSRTYPNLARMSLEQKLKHFQRLVLSSSLDVPDTERARLEKWLERANEARITRNAYVHGHWQLLYSHAEKPVSLFAPPWMRSKLGLETELRMSLDEFQAMVDAMATLVQEFLDLRKLLQL